MPQHMQRRSFGNREPPVHDQPTSETHDEISTTYGKTVHSSSAHTLGVAACRTSLSLSLSLSSGGITSIRELLRIV